MALATPNIIVYSAGENSTIPVASISSAWDSNSTYSFKGNDAVTAGESVNAYFYICNKATDSTQGTPHTLVRPQINLSAISEHDQTISATSTTTHTNIKLFAFTTNAGSLSPVTTANSSIIAIKSADSAHPDELAGVAYNASIGKSAYSKIRIVAAPAANSPAGSYSYQLSIKGTYT